MAVVQKATRIPAQQQGVQVITLTIDLAAGADSSQAFTFDRAFAAAPMAIAIVRADGTGLDVACTPSLASLTSAGGTLRQKGTSTVIMTYNVTFVGDYNNATAY
jgi:hypothetical protein